MLLRSCRCSTINSMELLGRVEATQLVQLGGVGFCKALRRIPAAEAQNIPRVSASSKRASNQLQGIYPKPSLRFLYNMETLNTL